ncbi:MAG: phosphocholine cytidylyltransferase family protein [Candidatus Tectomicrobia bacterium]|nr:phosphocholine cytidylyltransferase family protein [Candidatus Tectomicrobia bacterium]
MRHLLKPKSSVREGVQAVILAAGEGQRLRPEGYLKPLTPVLDVTLLERTILACSDAGITECIVVLGYGKESIGQRLNEFADRVGIQVRGVENPHWEEGNGTSALAARPYVSGSFLLTMCDHVFDPAVLRALVDAGKEDAECLLAVDYRIDEVFRLDDATKVQLTNGTITAIGKNLQSYTAVDVGLFFCRPRVFDALQEARDAGEGSLSAGWRRLIPQRLFQAIDIGEAFWVDVDTPESLQHAERILRRRQAEGPCKGMS